MVALEFSQFQQTLVVLLSALVPGIALGWPLLRKSDFGTVEKLLTCFFLGLLAVPALLLLESFVGIGFSLFLVLANIFLLTAAGLFWGIHGGAFALALPSLDFGKAEPEELVKKYAAPALLLLAVFLAFFIRLQPFTPIYSELDPYWYVYGTGQIIRDGAMPLFDDTGWWPEVQSTHRAVPLKAYLEAQWYSLYTGGGAYNNYLLFVTSSWLPPIGAALMAFGAYLLFSYKYSRKYGVFAAFMVAFLPITIFKMSAGVNEATPLGMIGIFMMIGTYAVALKKKDLRFGLLSSLGFFATILGSNYSYIAAVAFGGFVMLQSLDYFHRGKWNEYFFRLNLIVAAGAAIASVLGNFYAGGSLESAATGLITTPMLITIVAIGFSYACRWLVGRNWEERKRIGAIAAAALVFMVFLFTPFGGIVKDKLFVLVGYANFNQPLDRTIAEQNKAGSSFEWEVGFLAVVPANHVETAPVGLPAQIMSLFYDVLDKLCWLFSMLGNWALAIADSAFNAYLGSDISTDEKSNSLMFLFLMVATVGLALRHFQRKGEERDEPSVGLFLLLVILPAAYIGLNKIKFVIFVGVAVAMAAVAAIAELERLFRWLSKKLAVQDGEMYVGAVFVVLMLLITYAQAAGPMGYAKIALGKSLETRYQDDPAGKMPHLAALCDEIKKQSYYDAYICEAGANISFADTINAQYNSEVCLVSQLSMKELFPSNSTEAQSASQDAKNSAAFRCNRLSEYWVDSMEWINKNVDPSDRVTSWWDYGHWINFFGDRKTVLRNEHRSKGMIGRVAHDYIDGSPEDLQKSMNYYDSRYVLFDMELIGGSSFGGKYGALNYLSCAHDDLTTTRDAPGSSQCEFDHSPERLVVPTMQTTATVCTISESQQRKGVLAYTIGKSGIDVNKPAYCVGDFTLPSGEKITATYYLDRKDENGDLVLSKGFMRKIDEQQGTAIVEMVYNNKKVWPGQNGTLVDGMEDAKTKFYVSNLYRGFYLEELPGYDLVYKSANGEVKIYKMRDFSGNKEGIIDPVSAAKEK